ncbi:tRNA pseudouridine(13) synthase TruD [uncultured Psychrobacter sp.]|jgi:tRNA pseudouridine13 synthase|uniref:tRNA pseudouridine(13) synthase TruD n=1 Tax=uncultured Psychrobacter sp. TaxID=259303 RepID=UPI000C8CED52|nr:tRNA pseudouridine(13) synthase TruD [uncultured Psychrobacter sp.]MAF75981.1 tRNA pseudouridine(13) synthase TruD [Idiomarinaceae bacterium]
MTAIENQHLDPATIDFAAVTNSSDLPQPMTPPIKQALYKAKPEDFVVNERLEVDFTGEGEHLWLHIKKSGINTAYLAKLLSEWADIPLRDVGYSGLKDRQALTTQWFSLRLPKKQKPDSDFAPVDIKEHETVKIIAEHWHNKKLNRGTHNANQFVITLRDIEFAKDQTLGDKSSVEQHLQTISETGVPNYFGPQRFGFGGNNIREALNLFARPLKSTSSAKKKNKRKSAVREQNSMELSAARSLIFNQILAARVQDGSWNTGLNGEVFNLNGSGSIFASEHMDETLQARLASGDIHPTAVMWGAGNDKVAGDAAELENTVVQQDALLAALATGLEQREVKAQRRALRLPVEDLSWRWADKQDGEQTLVLSFKLTTGSFATSVLASVVEHLTVR